MNKRINLLIMPSNRCNLNCSYCFHGSALKASPIMALDSFKKIIDVATKDYETIQIVWHGGEPLMTPIGFYEEAYDYCLKHTNKFLFSIQTNATLISKEWIDLFKKTGTKIGVSYDGITNQQTRGHSELIKNNILKIKQSGLNVGCILVVSDINVNLLKENYAYFSQLGVSVKFNPLIIQGMARSGMSLSYSVYAKKFVELFKEWIFDTECKINLQSFYDILNLITTNHTGVCTFNSCLGSWLCIDYLGNIYPCDRLYSDDFFIENIHSINTFQDVFDTDKFISILMEAINRRDQCKKDCEYFEKCYGGCNSTAFLENGISQRNESFCKAHKFILSQLIPFVNSVKSQLPNVDLNPRVKHFL